MLRTLQLVLPISKHSTDHYTLACEGDNRLATCRPPFFPLISLLASLFTKPLGIVSKGPRCAAASPVAPPRCFTRDEELADTGDRVLGHTVDTIYSRDRSAPARPTDYQDPAVVG